MSQYFPHTAYAEDQNLFKTILTTHVLYRGFQTGATIGMLTGAARSLLLLRGSSVSTMGPVMRATFERSTGVGAAIGTALMVPGLVIRMWGREEIEWRDRSWRLLENKGQMEVDNWSIAGTVLGTAGAVIAKSGAEGGARWKRVVGGAGIGNMVGVLGYMGWRYGVHRGKWED